MSRQFFTYQDLTLLEHKFVWFLLFGKFTYLFICIFRDMGKVGTVAK